MENVFAEGGVRDKEKTGEVRPEHPNLAGTTALREKTTSGITETRRPTAGKSELASV